MDTKEKAKTATLIATYEDGVLRLPHLLDLPEHTQVRIQIQSLPEEQAQTESNVLKELSDLATDLGVDDLAEQHDHYLYGTDKR